MSDTLRPLGALADAPDARDYRAAPFLYGDGDSPGAGAPRLADLVGSQDYRQILASPWDQRGSSCVGQRSAGQVDAQARARGHRPRYPSPYAIYSLARQLQYGALSPLIDTGSSPRYAIKAMASWGVVPAEQWNPTDLNERVTVDVLHEGAEMPIKSYHRIDGTEEEIAEAICAALDVKLFPSFVMPVDEAFMRLGADDVYDGLRGAVQGYHDQMIAGYVLATPQPYAIVRGSWGLGWADMGYAKISLSFIASASCRDRWVLDTSPVLQ